MSERDIVERLEALESVAHEPVSITIGNIMARLEALEERLRSAPGETEALREALEEIASMGPVSMSMVLRAEDLLPEQRKRVSQMQGIARRALSQHVGGEG